MLITELEEIQEITTKHFHQLGGVPKIGTLKGYAHANH
jgi:hypothetical protein